MKKLGNVMILGDSYSTFLGHIPKGYAWWYSEEPKPATDVINVEQTWWKQLLSKVDANLVLNCSWSGTTIGNTGYDAADCSKISFIGRLDALIEQGFFEENKIDTLFVFGGTNDTWSQAPLGELMLDGWKKEDLFFVLPAVGYLAKRVSTLSIPRCIFVVNTEMNPKIANAIVDSAAHFSLECVVLKEISKQSGHPDIRGMQQIATQVLEAL